MKDNRRILEEHDISDMIGLRVIVADTAQVIDDDEGDTSIEIPEFESLSAAAAVARSLMPVRLLGTELKAIRKIAGWTAADLAAKMGEKTSPETISRWENGKQPMGGYAEKVFRLLVCESLKDAAPGIPYDGSAIAHLIILDPWKSEPAFEVPYLHFHSVKIRKANKNLPAWEVDEDFERPARRIA